MGTPEKTPATSKIVFVSFDVGERSMLQKAIWALVLDRRIHYTLIELTPKPRAEVVFEHFERLAREGEYIFIIEEIPMFIRLYRELVSRLLGLSIQSNHIIVATSDTKVMRDADSDTPRYPEALRPLIVGRDQTGIEKIVETIREINQTVA